MTQFVRVCGASVWNEVMHGHNLRCCCSGCALKFMHTLKIDRGLIGDCSRGEVMHKLRCEVKYVHSHGVWNRSRGEVMHKLRLGFEIKYLYLHGV